MPVIYQIDKTRKLIRTQCIGAVTFKEVTDHFRLLEQDPDCPERLDVLLDLTAMGSMPESIELMAVSQEIGRIRGRVRFNACAIVVQTDALFGMIRMFEVFVEGQFDLTKVFRTVNDAETWLILQKEIAARNPNA